jgi:hypothetical protein
MSNIYPPSGQDPQQPMQYPHPPGGWGYAPYPMDLPKQVKTARTLIFVLAGLSAVLAVVVIAIADDPAYAMGYMLPSFVPIIVAFILALQFRTCGDSARIAVIIAASFMILLSLASMAKSGGSGILSLVMPVFIIVNLSKREAKAWFNRPRH